MITEITVTVAVAAVTMTAIIVKLRRKSTSHTTKTTSNLPIKKMMITVMK